MFNAEPIVGGAAAECDGFDRPGWDTLSIVITARHVFADPSFKLVDTGLQLADLRVATDVC